ncbi:MAG: HEAT repeat domain-containing protein [Chloroflexi bacterium]|nr:HEAT repeat domain-containing protein [Chloroflexota bacterium]
MTVDTSSENADPGEPISSNPQLIEQASDGDMASAERLLRKLLSTDIWEESTIDTTLRNVHDQELWKRLLEVLAQRTWNGQPVPIASSEIKAGRSLDLKLRSLFLDNEGAGAHARLAALLESQTDENAAIWQTAALLLGQRGDNRATEPLLRVLQLGDSKAQARAAAILSNLQDDRIVAPLIEALANGDSIVHWEAAKSLSSIGAQAVPELCDELQHTHDDHLRWHITRTLGEIGDPQAVPSLIALLADENAGIRWRSAEALVSIGPASLPALLRKLMSEKITPWLRVSALAVLRGFGDKETARLVHPLVEAMEGREAAIEAPVVARQILEQIEQ